MSSCISFRWIRYITNEYKQKAMVWQASKGSHRVVEQKRRVECKYRDEVAGVHFASLSLFPFSSHFCLLLLFFLLSPSASFFFSACVSFLENSSSSLLSLFTIFIHIWEKTTWVFFGEELELYFLPDTSGKLNCKRWNREIYTTTQARAHFPFHALRQFSTCLTKSDFPRHHQQIYESRWKREQVEFLRYFIVDNDDALFFSLAVGESCTLKEVAV